MSHKPVRLLAAECVAVVVDDKRSLDKTLLPLRQQAGGEGAKLAAICYGSIREYFLLDAMLALLLAKPFRKRDRILHFILLTAIYQLKEMRTPDHVVVTETVELAAHVRRDWARPVLNAVLRNYLRQKNNLNERIKDDASKAAMPMWLYDQIKQDWPQHFHTVMDAINQKPPMHLRVNQLKMSRDAYMHKLKDRGIVADAINDCETAIELHHAVDVEVLPGFCCGEVSVQDVSAQRVAELLQTSSGMRVLDACAAPGGKTGHILEDVPDVDEMVAIDKQGRIDAVKENLKRLGVKATVMSADSTRPDQWWDRRPFSRILLDAPCSGSGVIRRHPDIKLTRRKADLQQYADYQLNLLCALWQTLAENGKLLYVTCSIFREENDDVIERFLQNRQDAKIDPIQGSANPRCRFGLQLLPGMTYGDGFYFSRLTKTGHRAAP